MRYSFTSESVTEGHPDKVADAISDSVLDAMLREDPRSRVACETLVTTGLVLVSGEITTEAYVNISTVARDTVARIGYTDPDYGIDGRRCGVLVTIDPQSPDIAQGVDKSFEVREGTAVDSGDETGAGDQGMMFGYACRETEVLMPAPIHYAHRLAERLAEARRSGDVPGLRPDGKTQVTMEYEDGRPVRVETVVISAQHDPHVDLGDLRDALTAQVLEPVIPERLRADGVRFLVNPTGAFIVGGPQGDVGVTGRKIIVDTYGGMGRHGGGAFSGKDPTKVDRSGSYAARWVAKNIVAAGIAERCEVQIAYAIGVARPVSVLVETFGTSTIPPERLEGLVRDFFDLRPARIFEQLDLFRPIFAKTSAYGHFGRELPEFTWEHTDRADDLRTAATAL